MISSPKNYDSNDSKHPKRRRFDTFEPFESQKFGPPNIFLTKNIFHRGDLFFLRVIIYLFAINLCTGLLSYIFPKLFMIICQEI